MITKSKAAAWFAVLLLLVGCAPQTAEPARLTAPFVCTLRVTDGDFVVSGRFTRRLISCSTFTLEQPEELAGLTFSCENGAVTADFLDLSAQREGLLPPAAYLTAVNDALDVMARADSAEPQSADADTATYAGAASAGRFAITYDRESGDPVTLQTGNGIWMEFMNVAPFAAAPSAP